MSDTEVYLSEEFVSFSQKMTSLHTAKKAKQEELTAIYEKIKGEIKEINDQAADAKATWDEFVAQFAAKKIKKE